MTNLESMQSIEERLANIERKLDIQAQEAKNILTLEEVAEYTHLSKSYVYKLTSKGDIPYYKPNGKQLYFKRTEIDEWLLTNRNKTNQEIEREIATKSVLSQKRF
ncbi:helix-turn-helix transcriptional regulator [Capnocytophaga gingivalis]|uniref:helix-turn-helix transcriptional regulator n=1 Tax=Capnocytophaga gingivalis TaxID=1017 RepID=UPI002B4885D5|nr:helix-turn-helix domain-containing protein [Capnocytophaga gingivalis]MEB3013252.1 helix-turn-helix domain-containing protein [Capnocytophaga gingivalis]